jgi:hypothetical protein
MHIVMLVVYGLVALAVFVLGAWQINRSRAHKIDGAWLFIWAWLLASIINGFVGVFRANIPVLNEIGAFIPIFGIPAAIAWYLSTKRIGSA